MPALNIQPTLTPEFTKGSSATNPIPPPGLEYDGRASEDLSALYPSTQQVTTITLATSIAATDVLTLTITPILMATGSAWADEIGPVSVTFESPGTDLDVAAQGLVDAAAAAQTVVSLDDLANFQRITDFVLVTKGGTDELVLTSTQAGATFSYTLTATGATTESSVTTGTPDEPMQVGIVVVADGYQANGQPKMRAFAAGDTVADILGILRDSNMCEPLTPGAPHRFIVRKRDAPYRSWGSVTAQGGSAGVRGNSVWIREVAGTGVNEVQGSIDPVDGGNHTEWPAATYLRDTSVSGTQAILIDHP